MPTILLATLLVGPFLAEPSRFDIPTGRIASVRLFIPHCTCDAESYALAERGPTSVPALRRRLVQARSRPGRFSAACGLGRIVPKGRDALLRLLARTKSDELRLACLVALPDDDEASIVAATQWLPLPRETDDLWDGIYGWFPIGGCGVGVWDPEKVTFERITTAILREGQPLTEQVLERLLSSRDADLRRHAAWALRVLGEEAPAVDALTADVDPFVRLAAFVRPCVYEDDEVALALRERVALRAARDADPLVRDAGLLGLACDDTPSVPRDMLPILRVVARDATASETTRAAAASLALTVELSPEDVRVFLALFGDENTSGPGRAALKAHADVAGPWLEALALDEGPARIGAIEMLTEMSRPLPPSSCEILMSSGDTAARVAVIHMYAAAGDAASTALPCLEAQLEDAMPWIREVAAGAIPFVAPDDVAAIRRAAGVLQGAEHSTGLQLSTCASHATIEALAREGPPLARRAAWSELAKRAGTREEAHAVVERALSEAPPDALRSVLASLEFRDDVLPQDLSALRCALPR